MSIKQNEPEQVEGKLEKLPENQRTIIDFTLGKRAPSNAYERELLQEIQEMERKGIAIDMPFD